MHRAHGSLTLASREANAARINKTNGQDASHVRIRPLMKRSSHATHHTCPVPLFHLALDPAGVRPGGVEMWTGAAMSPPTLRAAAVQGPRQRPGISTPQALAPSGGRPSSVVGAPQDLGPGPESPCFSPAPPAGRLPVPRSSTVGMALEGVLHEGGALTPMRTWVHESMRTALSSPRDDARGPLPLQRANRSPCARAQTPLLRPGGTTGAHHGLSRRGPLCSAGSGGFGGDGRASAGAVPPMTAAPTQLGRSRSSPRSREGRRKRVRGQNRA